MRGIFTGQRGLAPALLVVVLAWALAAVLMLTGTLVSARRIHRDVQIITPEYGNIATDSHAITLAKKTARVSGEIADAAQPLTGHLAATLDAARSIDGTAKSILHRADGINATVGSIGNSVGQIHASVGSIDANLSEVLANARAINASARAINASARAIRADVQSVRGSVLGIRARGHGILDHVTSIHQWLVRDNRQADRIRGLVPPLGADLAAVRPLVVSIDGHANAIDCSRLINSAGRTRGCIR